MNEAVTVISLSAAFIAGVVGSVHCFGMCGGLAGAIGMRARAMGVAANHTVVLAALSQLGRIGSYALIGAIVGAVGNTLTTLMSWVHLAVWLRGIAGVLLILMALRIATSWNAFVWLERLGAKLWSIAFSKRATRSSALTASQALTIGVLWGWLPCGLVYSMALYAAMSANPVQGAMIMIAFGAGTLPSMLSSSLLAGQLARLLQNPKARWLAAGILAAFGVWTLVFALRHAGHH